MRRPRAGWWLKTLAIVSTVAAVPAEGGGPTPSVAPTLRDLVRMTPGQLDALFAAGVAGPIPSGRLRGRALVRPGSRLAPLISGAAGAVWQGKVFDPARGRVQNRFFGIRSVPAAVAYGPSWRDGAPAIVLDYSQTSRLYADFRDEIRQIGPNLYLGLMFDRTTAPPELVTYFALEAR